MREFHITNKEGKNTAVRFAAPKVLPAPRLGFKGVEANFFRYLACSEETTFEELSKNHGNELGTALIEGDPEINVERVGIRIEETKKVFIEGHSDDNTEGKVRHAPPLFVEVLYNPDGSERERRPPNDIPANINEDLPVFWTGKKIKRREALRQFVMTRSVQIFHKDGLTYDYLFSMAQDLHKEDVVVLLGAGAKGKEPLVFQSNGTPYRGFLEGRTNGTSYKLLLHLSNMELKRS